MAKENRTWGCVRIHGELIKVGHGVSITAIRNLLRKHRVPGSPFRSGLSWKAFLKAQASAIVLTDFIEVDTVFLKRLYVLLYVELATRRVIWFGVTEAPNAQWVTRAVPGENSFGLDQHPNPGHSAHSTAKSGHYDSVRQVELRPLHLTAHDAQLMA